MNIKIPLWLQIVLALAVLALVIYLTCSFDWVFEKEEGLL